MLHLFIRYFKMKILGISAFYHDSAAALIIDGKIKAAVEEERFTRIKHDYSFPINAIKFCLNNSSIKLADVDFIVFYEKPLLKFERLLETYFSFAPSGFNSFVKVMPLWITDKLFQKKIIIQNLHILDKALPESKILFSEHHISHAASAFYPSPFYEAGILILDGVGEWATSSIGVGIGSNIEIIKEINFPHSLGLLYSAFTHYTGFKVNSGEYKVMGLAPYGIPKYKQIILDNLIDVKADGSFRLNMEYFDYAVGFTMTNEKFHNLFGGPPRQPESPLTQKEMDIAASVQAVLEEIILLISKFIYKETGKRKLCLAGGVALNCVANGKIARANIFDKIWIQPASGDAGGAVGAALAAYYLYDKQPRKYSKTRDGMNGAYLGPSYTTEEIEERLTTVGVNFIKIKSESILVKKVAKLLSKGKIIGWFQGRAEFGPRSLGNRAILADSRRIDMQKTLNLKIKCRESFRPFAPAVLIDHAKEWFDLKCDSPYMLFTFYLKKDKQINVIGDLNGLDKLKIPRSQIPAVTHVDYSARVQTVDKVSNPIFYSLLKEFNRLTNCPVLINTSFNIRGEPIVNTPEDAFNCFMNTEIDYLIIGNFLINKKKQNPSLQIDYKSTLELD